MVKGLAILCLLLPQAAALEHRGSIDLEKILDSPAALRRVTLMWAYPPNAEFYVHGDGRLVAQAFQVIPDDPDNPFLEKNRSLVPTCSMSVEIAEIQGLFRVMVAKHFFSLPEKNYMYQTAADERRKLELHTITVDNGKEVAERTFGVGEYAGQNESLPADFAAVEDCLGKLRSAAFSRPHRPCGMAEGIKFGK